MEPNPPTPNEPPSPKRKRPRVLLVDDNQAWRVVVGHMLLEDYELLLAADGAEAVEWLREKSIDLLLSDVDMPHMDGVALTFHTTKEFKVPVTVTQRLRAGRVPPILLVTGLEMDDPRVKEALKAPNIVGVFHKPVDMPVLKEAIRLTLEGDHEGARKLANRSPGRP